MSKAKIIAEFESAKIEAGVILAAEPIDAAALAKLLTRLNAMVNAAAVYPTLYYSVLDFTKAFENAIDSFAELRELTGLAKALPASTILKDAEDALDEAESGGGWQTIAQFGRVLSAMKAMKVNIEGLFNGLDDTDGSFNEIKHVYDTLDKAIKEVKKALEHGE